jgi:hypothetical protein
MTSPWECATDSFGHWSPELLAAQMLLKSSPEVILQAINKECASNLSLSHEYRVLIDIAQKEIEDMEEELNFMALAEEHAAMQYGIEAMQSDCYDAEVAACGFNCY